MVDKKQLLHDELRNLVPLNGLAAEFLNEIANEAKLIGYRKGQYVFHQRDRDLYTFYLLKGRLELYTDERLAEQVTGGTERARYPLAQLQPRQLSAKARTDIEILRLERAALDKWLTMEHQCREDVATTLVNEVDEHSSDWMTCMLRSEIFARIPAPNIQKIFSCMEEVPVSAGDVIVRQGSPGDYYYTIREGKCAVSYAPSPALNPVRLAELGIGDSFGEEALVANATRNATVTMLTDGRLMRLTKDDFLELIKKPALRSVVFSEAQALVDQGALWLDLRFPDEHQHAALQGSINLPLNRLRTQMRTLLPSQRYVVYCDTGSRSAAGAFLLAQHGFDITHLRGGLMQGPLSEAFLEDDSAPPLAPSADPNGHHAVGIENGSLGEANDAVSANGANSAAKIDRPEASFGQSRNRIAESNRTLDIDLRVAAMEAELARVNQQLNEALRLKANADVERCASEEQVQLRMSQERERLAKEAARANQTFSEMQRLKEALEFERKQAKEALARRCHEEQALLRQLKEQTAQRIREQEMERAATADRQREGIVRLTTEIDKARHEVAEEVKRALARERQRFAEELAAKQDQDEERLHRRTEEAESRLEAERHRLQAEYARHAEEFARLQEATVQALRNEFAERFALEREQLEAEFAGNREAIEQLRQQKAAAEAERHATAKEMGRIIREQRAALERMRQDAEAERCRQRQDFEYEIFQLKQALGAMRHVEKRADDMRHHASSCTSGNGTEGRIEHASQGMCKPFSGADRTATDAATGSRLPRVTTPLTASEEDLLSAIQQQKLRSPQGLRDNLKELLESEMRDWLSHQGARIIDGHYFDSEAKWQRIKSNADASRVAQENADADLLHEVATQLLRKRD